MWNMDNFRVFQTLVLLLQTLEHLISLGFVARTFYLEHRSVLTQCDVPLFSRSDFTIKTGLFRVWTEEIEHI